MLKIQKTPFVSSGKLKQFSGTPPWLNNWGSPWRLDLGNDVGYGISEHEGTIYIQYGENASGWASIRYWGYRLEIEKEEVNPDNSITAELSLTPLFWESTHGPSRGSGYDVKYDIKVGGNSVWNYTGKTIDSVSKQNDTPIKVSTTIQPEQYYDGSLLEFSVEYPNKEAENSFNKIGYKLFNPNPKYKPWGLRRGTWRSLTSGFLKRRIKGQWEDRGQINQNKIRKSSTWKNQNKVGE